MLLLAFAAYLADPLALLGPLAFALFITRFQIIPEERVLSAKIGPRLSRLSSARSPLALMQETRAATTPNYDAILIGSGIGAFDGRRRAGSPKTLALSHPRTEFQSYAYCSPSRAARRLGRHDFLLRGRDASYLLAG